MLDTCGRSCSVRARCSAFRDRLRTYAARQYGCVWPGPCLAPIRYLRYAGGGHAGLVVEDAAKVVPVREHLGLSWQVGAAAVHQVQARQLALRRHLLQPQVFLRRGNEQG